AAHRRLRADVADAGRPAMHPAGSRRLLPGPAGQWSSAPAGVPGADPRRLRLPGSVVINPNWSRHIDMTNTTPDVELLADEARQHVLEHMPNNVNHIVKEQAVHAGAHAAVRYAAQQLRKIWGGDWLFSELEQRVFELESAAQRLVWPGKDMSPEE